MYTRFDKTKKVLFALQIVDPNVEKVEYRRYATPHDYADNGWADPSAYTENQSTRIERY